MEGQNNTEIIERLVKIEVLLENMNENNRLQREIQEEKAKKMEEQIKVANHRISDLEDTIKWQWRAIGGAIISTAVAFLMK